MVSQTDSEEGSEGGSDYALGLEDFSDVFVIPADWTVSTILSDLDRYIDLDPDFQRRSVWSRVAKSRFIESLALGIPIPQILLAEDANNTGKYIVLDGKQRLLTIKEFFSGKLTDGDDFKLTGLTLLRDMNGMTISDLETQKPTLLMAIHRSFLRTAVIRGWRREEVLYEMFHRLNSGSVRLSPMELRMSLIRGPYIRQLINRTSESERLQELFGLSSPDKRMKDVEVAIRFFAFNDRRIVYQGNLKKFLDDYCILKNRDDEKTFEEEYLNFDEVIESGSRIFSPSSFGRKFLVHDDRYEKPFNRAAFDVVAGALANQTLRNAAESDHQKFEQLYKQVCSNQEFIRAVESTTKSVTATRTRFSIWYTLLESEYKIPLRIPNIKDATN